VLQSEGRLDDRDGIMDGDYVIILAASARDGEMVRRHVSGEVTLKRFYHEGEKVRLQPRQCQ